MDGFPKISYNWGEWAIEIEQQKMNLADEMKSKDIKLVEDLFDNDSFNKGSFEKAFGEKKPFLFSGASKKVYRIFQKKILTIQENLY